jgi:CheY-like chemotaxis protein
MDKKILMIDDKKEAIHMVKDNQADKMIDKYYQEDEVHLVRTYKEGLEELQKKSYDTLLLDHDLGGIKTGYDILLWLEVNPDLSPDNIILISHNSVGVKNMANVLDRLLFNGFIKSWKWNW